MAITTLVGEETLLVTNDSRSAPVLFPGFDLTHDFTWSVWVKPLGTRGGPSIDVSIHAGTDGSRILIGHNGYTWAYSSRYGSVGENTIYFNDVVYDRWALLCFVKYGNHVTIGYGLEDPININSPVIVTPVVDTTTDVIFDLNQFYITVGHNQYMSNFKFWNSALNATQIQAEANRFDAGTTFWASPLRTPGDMSSIAYPSTGPNWAALHAYTSTPSVNNLKMVSDPAYLTTTLCPTWIYPIISTAISSFNPGLAPVVATSYDAPQFWQMQDRGSLPAADSTLQSIEYYGKPSSIGTGIPAVNSWGLYKDERGARVSGEIADPNYLFETDTGVLIPPGSINSIKISTLYIWQYGARFTWPAGTGPTAAQQLSYLHLLVSYIGIPTGIPGLPIDIPGLPVLKLTGLFAISKGSHTDKYNLDAELKIPAPTIKTAYIGE